MRSRSGNGANRSDQGANLRFVHPSSSGIKESALRRTARHPAAGVHSFHSGLNETGHLIGMDPSPGNHVHSGLNGLFDGGKSLRSQRLPSTGQDRSDAGRLQLSACLGVIDGFIERPVKDNLVKANSLVQLLQQNDIDGTILQQPSAYNFVRAEGQDRFSLRHDGLSLDGRVHEIPFARADEHPEAKAILFG